MQVVDGSKAESHAPCVEARLRGRQRPPQQREELAARKELWGKEEEQEG